MTELQREANRDFTPTVANIMHTVYEMCADEFGQGSFKRMKDHMSSYVEQNRRHMFKDATLTVKRHLESMCKALEDVMEEKADEIYIKMKADYMRVLGGLTHLPIHSMPRQERALRYEIMEILKSVDAQFEPIARGEISDRDNTVDGAVTPADEDIVVNVDDDETFQSAPKSTNHSTKEDSVFDDIDDNMITKPTSSKQHSLGQAP